MRVVDLKLNIDGLILKDGDNIEGYVKEIEGITNSIYEIKYEVLYEEIFDEE